MSRRGRKRGGFHLPRAAAIALILVIAAAATFALANTIASINPPRLDQQTSGITPYTLEPQQCKDAGINPTEVRTSSAPRGDLASQLILGSAGGTTLRGRGGDDCILGGGGNDYLRGDAGYDVCIGGGGTDTFQNCEIQIP
jgi:Ca2+-binding RTX toxin-like protein